MSKLNKTTQRNKTVIVPTAQGGTGTTLGDYNELTLLTLTSFIQDSFYESFKDKAQRLANLTGKVDAKYILDLALVARQKFNMRSTPTALVANYTLRHGAFSEDYVRGIFLRGDEITEYFGAIEFFSEKKTITNQAKKVASAALNTLSQRKALRYSGKSRQWSLSDVIQVSHAKPKDAKTSALFKALISWDKQGSLAKGWAVLNEAEQRLLPDFRKAVNGEDNGEISWERTASAKGAEADWATMLLSGGYMALIRNLRNALEKVDASNTKFWDAVVKRIEDRTEVRNSKQFPYRFYSAHKAVKDARSGNRMAARVLRALETALDYSVDNVPALDGKTLIISDTSGSMSTPVSEMSEVSAAEIALLMGVIGAIALDGDFVLFATQAQRFTINKSVGVLQNMEAARRVGNTLGGGTNLGTVPALVNLDAYQNILIFSDMQFADKTSGDISETSYWGARTGGYDRFNAFKGNIFSVNLCETKGLVGIAVNPKKQNVVSIGGWSDSTFQLLTLLGVKGGIKQYITDEAAKILNKAAAAQASD